MINFLILILSAENLKSLDKLCELPVNVIIMNTILLYYTTNGIIYSLTKVNSITIIIIWFR